MIHDAPPETPQLGKRAMACHQAVADMIARVGPANCERDPAIFGYARYTHADSAASGLEIAHQEMRIRQAVVAIQQAPGRREPAAADGGSHRPRRGPVRVPAALYRETGRSSNLRHCAERRPCHLHHG